MLGMQNADVDDHTAGRSVSFARDAKLGARHRRALAENDSLDDDASARSVSWARSVDASSASRDDGAAPFASHCCRPRPPVVVCAAVGCGSAVRSGYRRIAACCVRPLCRSCAAAPKRGQQRDTTPPPARCECGALIPRDDAEIVELLRRHADGGHVEAMARLGVAHARGHFGVARDARRAAALYDRAAVEGSAPGQYNLGLAFLVGSGVKQSKSRAAKWFRAAAAQDFPPGVHNLGAAYAYGTGVPKDQRKAIALFRRAAGLGDANAAFCLGQAHRSGAFGAPRDASTAAYYLATARDLGHPAAAAALAGVT